MREWLRRSVLTVAALTSCVLPLVAQGGDSPHGEWRYWGGHMSSTRHSPLDQINAENFSDLEVAWVWRGDNYGPSPDFVMRSTPIYADGVLYTVAGLRRTVIAIDPATGETIWTFREPHTERWESSPRRNYGRGVAYAEVDGRGVIYVVTPASSCTRWTRRRDSRWRASAATSRSKASRRRAPSTCSRRSGTPTT
jgi:glucose dehydrogenase